MELQLSNVSLRSDPIPETSGATLQQDLIVKRDMAALEQKLCDYVDAEYCVTVESATTGMLLALKAVGVGEGDSVLCTSFSYFALTEIITLAGATPILVDINPNTYNIDPYCLEYIIGKCMRSRQPMPRALIAVDLFGMPCNYDALEEICTRHGIFLIEDMAQSFGASVGGRRTGSFGRMAVASFFPSKPIDDLGEGGAVFCHTPQDARQLEALRRKVRMETKQRVLYNTGSYLDRIEASIVSEKLVDFDFELECRKEVASHYRERLEGFVKLQQFGEGVESAYNQYVISLQSPEAREAVIDYLSEHRIPCQVFDPSPVRLRSGAQQQWNKLSLVNAKNVAKKILSLPIHPFLSRNVVNFICDRVMEALERYDQTDQPSVREKKEHPAV